MYSVWRASWEPPECCRRHRGAKRLPPGGLSDGIPPAQAADRKRPTAVLRSAAKLDHARTGGTLLNQKSTPRALEGEDGLDRLAQLVRSYFRMDGRHIPFNVVTAETLKTARKEPDKCRDLIVGVAGYSH